MAIRTHPCPNAADGRVGDTPLYGRDTRVRPRGVFVSRVWSEIFRCGKLRGLMSDPHPAICLVCGESRSRLRYQITRFQVLQCSGCEQIFLYPLPSEREIQLLFAQLYATGGGSLPELESYYGFCFNDSPDNPLVQLYQQWLDRIEDQHRPGRLLDVGSGTGLFLAIAARRGWEVYGIDDSSEASQVARDRFGLDLWVGDFADFESRGLCFDVITGWDIIEHTRRPVELLETMRRCLSPGGSFVLSTPDQASILDLIAGALYRLTRGRSTAALEKFYIEQHFLYFTQTSLDRALDRAGLEVTNMQAEITDLRRLTLNPLMRGILIFLFFVARHTGLENRIFAMARAKVESAGSEAHD